MPTDRPIARRSLLTAAVTAAALSTLPSHAAEPAAPAAAAAPRQWIELRTYHFATPAKRDAYAQFLASAGVPALSRAGVTPVGIWTLAAKDNAMLKLAEDPSDLYVLLPHASAESVATLESKLVADAPYQEAFKAVAGAQKDPAYTRFESQLMVGFSHFPTVQAPATKAAGRFLQLRTYESHNAERAAKKLDMFNTGGELAIFQKVGMTGVFFGQTVAGAKMPNLTYALTFPDDATQKKAWDAFRADPDWKKLSADTTYKDAVSTITNLILRPTAGSQI